MNDQPIASGRVGEPAHRFEYRRSVAREPVSCVVYGPDADPAHDEPMKFTITRDGEQLSAEDIVGLLNDTSDLPRGPAILDITRRAYPAAPAEATHHVYHMTVLLGGMVMVFDATVDLRTVSRASEQGDIDALVRHQLELSVSREMRRMFNRDFDKALSQMETRP